MRQNFLASLPSQPGGLEIRNVDRLQMLDIDDRGLSEQRRINPGVRADLFDRIDKRALARGHDDHGHTVECRDPCSMTAIAAAGFRTMDRR